MIIRGSFILFSICLFLFQTGVKGQIVGSNIFSYSNSLKYADHLSDIKDYRYASLEYERLLNFKPKDDSLCLKLLQSYRLSNEWDLGILSFEKHRPLINQVPSFVSKEFVKLLILKEDFSKIDFYLSRNSMLSLAYKDEISLSSLMLQKNWKEAYDFSLSKQIQDPILLSYAQKSRVMKRKKPFVASLLSVLVPGLGKVYAGDWKNGISSFVFVGSAAYGASRGFGARGINSGLGWVFTGVGTFFYLGSVYGSHKEARNYNYKQSENLKNEVAHYLHSNF